MNKPSVVPVDTHVWSIAVRDIDPTLAETKSLTPKVHDKVNALFVERCVGASVAARVLAPAVAT